MVIQLQHPYSGRYSRGYIVTNPEGRNTVILYNGEDDRSSVSYARYLMACHLRRFLNDNEEVDHINGIKCDDTIENLQILSKQENITRTMVN